MCTVHVPAPRALTPVHAAATCGEDDASVHHLAFRYSAAPLAPISEAPAPLNEQPLQQNAARRKSSAKRGPLFEQIAV